jgi:hypothetical protein
MKRADNISDPDLLNSFLEDVRVNRTIVEEYGRAESRPT